MLQIEPKRDEDPNPAVERVVTIKGSADAKWKASYMVFEKLNKEGFAGHEDVRLRTAIKVPRSVVGRVIGKKGNNVSACMLARLITAACMYESVVKVAAVVFVSWYRCDVVPVIPGLRSECLFKKLMQ